MIHSVSFTNAALEDFADANLWFLVSTLAKKNLKKLKEAINLLGILKKYVPMNKIYFCLKEKSNVSRNKKVIFNFHTIFKLDFITQIIYCIIHKCMYFLFILLLFSYISF